MAPTFNKGDRVKLKATLFDNGKRDRNGLLFSEDWLAKGNGEWCYGTVSFVYVKKGRQAQKYRVKYDGGQTMTSLEDQMEVAGLEEENSDESSAVDELEGSDYEASDGSGSTHDLGRVRGVQAEKDTPEDTDPEEKVRWNPRRKGEFLPTLGLPRWIPFWPCVTRWGFTSPDLLRPQQKGFQLKLCDGR